MFDIGWSEMALILAVALVVIGPKDLPRVARQVGKWSAKARSMARDFQRSIDDMAREAELHDLKAEIEKASRGVSSLGAELERHADPDGEIRRTLEPPRHPDIDPPSHVPPALEPPPAVTVEPLAAANAGEPPAMPTLPPAAVTPALPVAISTDKA